MSKHTSPWDSSRGNDLLGAMIRGARARGSRLTRTETSRPMSWLRRLVYRIKEGPIR